MGRYEIYMKNQNTTTTNPQKNPKMPPCDLSDRVKFQHPGQSHCPVAIPFTSERWMIHGCVTI